MISGGPGFEVWRDFHNVGGRVVDVQADKLAANGVYAAVSGGGVWHSADGGVNWTTGVARRSDPDDGRVGAGCERHAVGRHG